MEINNVSPARPIPMSERMYLTFIRPKNINIRQVVNNTAAVEKFAGRINPQTRHTGKIIGRKADLKSLMLSCFLESERATNSSNAIFARSEV